MNLEKALEPADAEELKDAAVEAAVQGIDYGTACELFRRAYDARRKQDHQDEESN